MCYSYRAAGSHKQGKNSHDILEHGLQILLYFPDYVAVVLALVWFLWIEDTTNTFKHEERPGCVPSY
jgi:hypothetical protein